MPIWSFGSTLPSGVGRRLASSSRQRSWWTPADEDEADLSFINKLDASLTASGIHCSSSFPRDAMVVDKERRKSRKKKVAVVVCAHHQGLWRRSYGAFDGCRLPASSASPLIFMAEGRPILFLPAFVSKGRQYISCSALTTSISRLLAGWQWSGQGHGEPSGVVPGVVVIAAVQDLWTRLRSFSSVQGPLQKRQGLVCNMCFSLCPDVNCSVPPLYV